jgi:cyclophilin family peptidyl-prolyl cis-trans isomerase
MKFKFYPEAAPMHVTNFVYLTKLGYFDGLGFHRVIKGFMAQGGCPTGTGSGTPGYRYETETSPKYTHSKRGILSTARTNMRDTDGSQFFIMFAKKDFLDNQYSVFGECIDGLAVLDAFEAVGKERDPAPPSEPLTITKATVAVE